MKVIEFPNLYIVQDDEDQTQWSVYEKDGTEFDWNEYFINMMEAGLLKDKKVNK